MLGANTSAASGNLVRAFTALAESAHVASGLAALYAYESQIPAVATAKIDGLKRFYGIDAYRGLEFFKVHEKADVVHARIGADLLRQHSASSRDSELAVDAARRALGALWSMLNAC